MPWFGMDIGGTLTKLVYFEPNEDEPEGDQEAKIIQKIRHYLTKNAAYGETGHRDIHLQVSRIDFHLETTSVYEHEFITIFKSADSHRIQA